jgi:hypothetical protein
LEASYQWPFDMLFEPPLMDDEPLIESELEDAGLMAFVLGLVCFLGIVFASILSPDMELPLAGVLIELEPMLSPDIEPELLWAGVDCAKAGAAMKAEAPINNAASVVVFMVFFPLWS